MDHKRAILSAFNKPQLKWSILLKESLKAPLTENFSEISFKRWIDRILQSIMRSKFQCSSLKSQDLKVMA